MVQVIMRAPGISERYIFKLATDTKSRTGVEGEINIEVCSKLQERQTRRAKLQLRNAKALHSDLWNATDSYYWSVTAEKQKTQQPVSQGNIANQKNFVKGIWHIFVMPHLLVGYSYVMLEASFYDQAQCWPEKRFFQNDIFLHPPVRHYTPFNK